MPSNVLVLSSSGDPLSDQILTGDTIQEAAKDPGAIGRLLIDMAFSEGKDIESCAFYIERSSNAKRMLDQFATGAEDFMTGGWVRVITPPHLYLKEQPQIQAMLNHGNAVDHGFYRGVRLIEFCVTKADVSVRSKAKGFGK